MKPFELLTYLRDLGAVLWVEDGKLRYRAPRGALTPALLAELAAHKAEILPLLYDTGVTHSARPMIQAVARGGALPLSFAQQRLWLVEQLAPGLPTYNIPAAVRLSGSLDVAALQRSFDVLSQRHETLRTTFATVDGQPVQVISAAAACSIVLLDFRALPSSAREAVALQSARMMARRPFDLARRPLLRAALLRLDAAEHVLMLVMHHIVSDGWSMGVLVRELAALYAACVQGRRAALPELPIQYADYAVWQRGWLQGAVLEQHLAYWRSHLGDPVPVLQLPTDRPRPAVQSFHGANQTALVAQSLAAALRELSRREGATLFTSLLAAFNILLARYTYQREIVVGSPIANRTQNLTEGLIGFFVNTLVLRVDVPGDLSFCALARQVRATMMDAYAHQDLPFDKLVEALQPDRDLSHTPLFQVAFTLQSGLLPALELPSLTLRPVEVDTGISKFDLTLTVVEEADQLALIVEYATDLFDAATIARMLGHFQALLAGIAAEPEQRVADLPLLADAERRQLLEEWNATTTAYPRDAVVNQLFEVQAAETPDAVALVYQTTDHSSFAIQRSSFIVQMTYAELNRRANQLAHHLRALGVRPEALVGLCLERSVELVIAMLGVLKAGGAYVPLDPDYPAERLAFMIEDAQVRVLLTASASRDKETSRQADEQRFDLLVSSSPALLVSRTVVDLRADWPAVARWDASTPECHVRAEQVAYVMYTSGSTGQPKGIRIPHRAIIRLVCDTNYVRLGAADRVAQAANAAFDAATFEIWGALVNGARLVGIDKAIMLAPQTLAATLRDQDITTLFVTTALFNMLAREAPIGLRGLRHLLFGGEAVDPRWVRVVLGTNPPARLLHVYGPTENTTFTTWYLVEDVATDATTVPIGRPIANTQIYLLDRAFQLAPVGVPGELYIGGDGLARDYLNRPDLTAARFIPNPFAGVLGARYRVSGAEPSDTRYPIPDTRLYKTGDLARYRPDGALEFLGRWDQQIKLRGFRIELSEITATLDQHPLVRESAVVLHEDGLATNGHAAKRLVAYVVPTRGQGTGDRGQEDTELDAASLSPVTYHLSPNELRSFLKTRLPDYMVPSAFVSLEALPLTPNGKLDRRALPPPSSRETALPQAGIVLPRTPTEAQIAGIWAELLGLEQIGIEDNFFALGGHSLLATQIITRVREAFQIELPLRCLYEDPTIAGIAAHVEQALPGASGDHMPPIMPTARDGLLPLSFAQQRLWFLDQLQPGSAAYYVPIGLRLNGLLDLAAFAWSLDRIVQRHEVLRTTFVAVEGQPAQIIALARRGPFASPLLSLIDLRRLPSRIRDMATRQLAMAQVQRPFDLARGPLIRAILVRLDAQEHMLLVTMHHIIADGWSLSVLVRELAAYYEACLAGRPVALPDLPIQYADYAIWQREWLEGAAGADQPSPLQTQLAYWRRQLLDLVPLDLPTDRPRGAHPTFRAGVKRFQIGIAPATQAQAVAQQSGATLFMTLLAAFVTLLARYSSQQDIAVGTSIANRNRAEIEPLIGFFVNTLVLRIDLSGDLSFRQLLERVRRRSLDAYAHQDLPFERLVEELQPERGLNYTPFFQVMFALQTILVPPLDLPGLTVEPVELGVGTTKFDLNLDLEETAEGLIGAFEYNIDLFDHTTIARMARHFQTMLAAVVADPDGRLDALSPLTPAEHQQLLCEWNAAAQVRRRGTEARRRASAFMLPTPASWCVHELFEVQVAATPDAIALVFQTADDERGWAAAGTGEACFTSTQHLTYGQLNVRANQLAHFLCGKGIGPDTLVGLEMKRSIELIVGVLGVLKAGGAYVPLDPDYPAERIAFMIQDSGAAVLITATNDARCLEGAQTNEEAPAFVLRPSSFVNLRADWPLIAQAPHDDPVGTATSEHLAYVIYTSGSTGRPKGVAITHAAMMHYVQVAAALFELGPHDRVLQFAPPSFDAAVEEIYPTLTSGATLLLRDDAMISTPATFLGRCRAWCLTLLDLPMAYWRHMIDELVARKQKLPPAVRLVVIGAEVAQPEWLATWRRVGARARLLNSYGPTETTVVVTLWEAPRTDSTRGWQTLPIGRALAGVVCYVLDARMRPAPIGVPGELYIGGAQVARGYLGRPELTAERFIPNPFAKVSGIGSQVSGSELSDTRYPTPDTRLYKTGDRVRWLLDGNLEFLGRVDRQIKLRGFRIELDEIEVALSQHSRVREAVVIVREDEVPAGGRVDKRLVAYVVPANDRRSRTKAEGSDSSLVVRPSSFIQELRDHLRQTLPDYMLPATFVLLEALPRMSNRKVDQRALPQPDRAWDEPDKVFVPPQTPIAEVLAGIWAQVLGIERVGAGDHFFALGGHSLLATQVITRVRDVFEVDLPLRSLFEAPALDAFAERVALACDAVTKAQAPLLAPVPRGKEIPLAFAQQRLWFLDQLAPGLAAYNIPIAMQLSGQLSITALQRSFDTIIQRHEALRTTFATVDGQPIQVIAPTAPLFFTLLDLRGLPAPKRASLGRRLASVAARRPFDLARGPLLRVMLFALDDHEHIILLVMHHIVSDGWSMGVLVRELAALYDAFIVGRPASLPDLPVQYADYAIWQHEWLQGAVLDAQLAYWKRSLDGSPPVLELPTDRPRPPTRTFRGASCSAMLSPALAATLDELSWRAAGTRFMTLLAAFQTLLARYSRQNDLVVGTPIANRTQTALEPLIGFFVNTLALRTDLSGNPSFRTLLQRVRAATLGAYTHQDLPFEQVVEALQPDRDLSRNPLFQVMFVLQNTPIPTLSPADLILRPLAIETGITDFDLTLVIGQEEAGLAASMVYNTDLFDASTIRRMLGHWQTLLQGVAADPDRRLLDFPLLSPHEQQQLLAEWNATQAAYPHSEYLHTLFERHCARTPDAVALVFDRRRTNDERQSQTDAESAFVVQHSSVIHLTYAELDRRANQLAHYFQTIGVGPDTLVGLSVERSPELVIGVLGIFKAGGAYLPLDPAYPTERLAFMLEDAGAIAIVTKGEEQPASLVVGPWSFVDLTADWPVIAAMPATSPQVAIDPANLAYVIYTSGSTGRPKGVLVAHRGLCNLIATQQAVFNLPSDSRILQFASFSFDAATFEIVIALVNGALLCMATPDALLPGPDLVKLLREHLITTVTLPPSALAVLPPTDLPALRTIIAAAEACPAALVARWSAGRRFFNCYGPTESTVWATFERCDDAGRSPPIGRPIANSQVYLLDRTLRPVPIGIAGELYIGGANLARGYLRRPDLTAERFVPNPFGTMNDEDRTMKRPDSSFIVHRSSFGSRLYRTGDLGRYNSDGTITFIERLDQQIKLRGFRIELQEIEAVLIQHPAVRMCVVAVQEKAHDERQLVAYIVPAGDVRCPEGAQTKDESSDSSFVIRHSSFVTELRGFLGERLPNYMLPSAFVLLDALPVTSTGKLDRRALSALASARLLRDGELVAPRTPTERLLVEIWSQVLGVEQVGIHDNFFTLGGDSILSIQVVSRAKQVDLLLTPRQLFENQTIAALAAVVGSAVVIPAEQGTVTGPAPLTPIQHWFFAQKLPEPQHWNQAVLLELRVPSAPELLKVALRHLLNHHDALRLRFSRAASGWEQINAATLEAVPFTCVNISWLPTEARLLALEIVANSLHAGLDLAVGPLLRVALFDYGAHQVGRLLIVAHHLVIDGVSWRILLEDLQTIYMQLAGGQTALLTPKTTSFKQWACRLAEYAQSSEMSAEMDYWCGLPWQRVARLPVDGPGGANTEASARSVTLALDAEQTDALLHESPRAYQAQVNDILLAALLQTLVEWMGVPALLLDLEGHGREPLFDDVDVTRTIGWFTTVFPALLELPPMATPEEAIATLQKQLQRIPNRGIGYGLLRYVCTDADIAARMHALPQAELVFNYLGQFDQVLLASSPFAPAPESSGCARSPRGQRSHLLEIAGSVSGGQLYLTWTYSAHLHRDATIERLAARLLELLQSFIEHCRGAPTGASMLPGARLAGIDRRMLARVMSEAPPIVDLYPLAPMQRDILRAVLHDSSSGAYLLQLRCTLQGALDVAAFRRAWQTTLNRHAILRTAFRWEALPEPLQLVQQQVTLPWAQHDQRHLTPPEQQVWLAQLIQTEHRRGFDLAQAPLMRLTLVRFAEERYTFIWSFHHLLLDGWSVQVLLKEVFEVYKVLHDGQETQFAEQAPYRDYITWLREQNLDTAAAFWRQVFAQAQLPRLLPSDPGGDGDAHPAAGYGGQQLELTAQATRALQSLARQRQLTLNTFAQGAWALLLCHYTGAEDVIFGVTLASRPTALREAESMVGLLINTLPVRVLVAAELPILSWLQQLQEQQVALRQYDYSPLARVQEWIGLPSEQPLFESVMRFQNYPIDRNLQERLGDLAIKDTESIDIWHYPLSIVVTPGVTLALEITYDYSRFKASTIARMLAQLQALLETMVAQPDQRLADLLVRINELEVCP